MLKCFCRSLLLFCSSCLSSVCCALCHQLHLRCAVYEKHPTKWCLYSRSYWLHFNLGDKWGSSFILNYQFVIYEPIYRQLLDPLCPTWGPNQPSLSATKETRFPVCVVDSQIVLTTQPLQSWATSSILLATTSTTTGISISTLPGTPQPKRREKGGLTATTAAAASFPPSHLRVGDRGRRSEQRGSQEEVPLRSVSPQPSSCSFLSSSIKLRELTSAVPILAASSLPQSILTHPV